MALICSNGEEKVGAGPKSVSLERNTHTSLRDSRKPRHIKAIFDVTQRSEGESISLTRHYGSLA